MNRTGFLMITQTATCVAQEPALEVSNASVELAQDLEQQVEDFAPTEDDITGSAEALLPVEQLARASIPSDLPLADIAAMRDRESPETPNTLSASNDSSSPSAKETSAEAMPTGDGAPGIAPQTPTPAQELLQSIRIGWRDVAGETARNIQRLSQATVEQALEIGQRLWRIQRDLNKKEYSTFLSILGWASVKARKFINLVKVFDGFEPSQLVRIELTTLLSLTSKRYSAVVDQLREVQDITQQLVEQLIKDTRKPRKPKQEPISGWKQNRSGGARRYEVILHDEQTGLSIEQQAEAEAILPHKVIEEAVALRLKSKTDQEGDSAIVVLQAPEQQDEQEQISALRQQVEAEAQHQARNRFEIREFALKREIADLKAQLLQSASNSLGFVEKIPASTVIQDNVASEPIEELPATTIPPSNEQREAIENPTASTGREDAVALKAMETPATATITQEDEALEPVESATCVQLFSDEKDALASENLDEDIEAQIAEFAPVHLSEPSGSPTEASDDYLEPISSDAEKQRKENVAQNLGAEDNSVFQSGDLVQINATSDKTWNGLRGYIQKLSAATGKAVVLLQGDYRSKHFFWDELKLVYQVEEDLSDAIQASAEQKELVEAYATTTVTDDAVAPEPMQEFLATSIHQSSSAEPVSDGSTTTVTDNAVALEQVQPASQPEASDDSATDCHILAADWDLIQELRAAESELRKIDTQIQELNSPLAQSGSNTVVERELKQLRSLQISEIVDLINSNLIPAYYEELQGIGRVVLDPKYASDFLMQAQSWADVVLVVGSSSAQLVNAVKEWSIESKQLLVQLLSEYLETEPSAFNQIDWLPKKLLGRTLSSLSFTVQRIKKSDNLVDEPEIEYISGCQFNSLSNLGTRHEQWVFHFEGNLIPAFARDEFSVEKF